MEIIEERLVGPSLGAANIKAGFESTLWGFIAVSVFMVIYYHLFGVFSAIALTCNLFLLVAILSMRENRTPQQAIKEGYDMAFNTILDSNITSLIAGIALLIFGSGPVRGFAVVHCLGISTSIFTSVMVSRALVNLWYGRRKKLTSLSIGQIWRNDADKSTAKGA